MPKTVAGAMNSLYTRPSDSNDASLFHSVKRTCKPTEKSARGTSVRDSDSKRGSINAMSMKSGSINAAMNPMNGGKRTIFLTRTIALTFPLCAACIAVMTPNDESITNDIWSHMTAIRSPLSPKYACVRGKPTNDVLPSPAVRMSAARV